MKTGLPWITTLAWGLLAVSPPGQDVFRSAFLSGEALSRSIWQPLYFGAIAVALVSIAIEALLRNAVRKRRRAPDRPDVAGPRSQD